MFDELETRQYLAHLPCTLADSLLSIAHHEAGHAVMGVLWDVPVTEARIYPCRVAAGLTVLKRGQVVLGESKHPSCWLHADLMIYSAGYAAQINRKYPWPAMPANYEQAMAFYRETENPDYLVITDLIEELGMAHRHERLRDQYISAARELLASRGATVERFALMLIDAGRRGEALSEPHVIEALGSCR